MSIPFRFRALPSYSLTIILLTVGLLTPAWAASPNNNNLPSLSGVTGLLDMPSARLMADWNIRTYYSWADPYGTFGMTATFLPWLEINGRVIRIDELPGFTDGNYGAYKDKALDFKLRLHKETEHWPAIALGATDIHGTGLFTSRYLAANKRFGPLDVTIGLGQGILAGEVTNGGGSAGDASDDAAFSFITSDSSAARIFGGLELSLSKRLSLMAEYSTLDYEKLKGHLDPASSPINLGARYRLTDKIMLSAAYLRGDIFSYGLSINFPLAPEGMLPWKPQPFLIPTPDLERQAHESSNEQLARILQKELSAKRFSNVRASAARQAVWLELENPTYLSNAKAFGRALRAIMTLTPERIDRVYLSLKSKDIIVLTMRINREDFRAFLDNDITDQQLASFIEMDNSGKDLRWTFLLEEPEASSLTPHLKTRRYFFNLEPKWVTLLNDPSGFARSRLSLIGSAVWYPGPGTFGNASLRLPLYNDVESSNEVEESDAARTDFIEYERQTDLRLETLAIDQVFDLPGSWLGRVEAGFFENAYGGLGAELFRFLGKGRWGIGLEGEWVKKRDVDNDFSMSGSNSYTLGFVNLYHQLSPDYGVDIGLKLGRFLAGDQGARLDVSRTFKHFTIGAWYTATDSKDRFEASYNQGYHDKGVYLIIPFSIFTDQDVPKKLHYSIKPWTRDPGQTVAQINWLYPMANKGNISNMQRSLNDMKQ